MISKNNGSLEADCPVNSTRTENGQVGTNIDLEIGKLDDGDNESTLANTATLNEEPSSSNDDLGTPPIVRFVTDRLSSHLRFFLLAVLGGYSIWACVLDVTRAIPLLVVEVTVAVFYSLSYLTQKICPEASGRLDTAVRSGLDACDKTRAPAILVILAMIVTSVLVVEENRNLVSIAGIVVFVAISIATSYTPRKIKWRPVLGGVALQFLLGLFILKSSVGYAAFDFLGDQVNILLGYTYSGSMLVYGYLADETLFSRPFQLADGGEYGLGPPLMFHAFTTLFFTGALVNILFYLGVILWVMQKIGYVMALIMGTSTAETLCAAANIFLGNADSPLIVRAFLNDMTDSELMAVMTGGFASCAGSALAAYVALGISATHLLTASVMSAPAALSVAKIILPETAKSKTASGVKVQASKSTDSNLVEAAANGASLAINLVLSIGAQVIAFVALVAMLDGFLAGIGSLIDVELSFSTICGHLFYPFAYLMGVPPPDCLLVSSLLGTKVFVNELVAYSQLAKLIQSDRLHPKSVVIATYALCGFSNFGSIGIQLGGLGSLVSPEKRKILSKLVFNSMVAGNTACWMTACIAGLFYTSSSQNIGEKAFAT